MTTVAAWVESSLDTNVLLVLEVVWTVEWWSDEDWYERLRPLEVDGVSDTVNGDGNCNVLVLEIVEGVGWTVDVEQWSDKDWYERLRPLEVDGVSVDTGNGDADCNVLLVLELGEGV